MWEVVTIALCGLGFTAAIAVLLLELVKLLGGAARMSGHEPSGAGSSRSRRTDHHAGDRQRSAYDFNLRV